MTIDINELRRRIDWGYFVANGVISELLDRLEAAESEALEQARLNGMGAERELALMAKLKAAEKAVTEAYQRGYETGQEEVAAERDVLHTMLEDERKEHSYTLRAAKAEAKQVDALRAELAQLHKEADKFGDGIDWIQRALQAEAKIAEMERQEPVAWIRGRDDHRRRKLSFEKPVKSSPDKIHWSPLYALPGAKGEEK